MATNTAPAVCNQPTEQQVPTPQVPGISPIPVAHDLASAIQAINAMRQAFMVMFGQIPHNNTTGARGTGNGSDGGSRPNDKQNKTSDKVNLQDFQEIRPRRVVETVRVFNPNDKNQFVDVDQITGVVFGNKAGQKIRFSQ